MKFKVDENLPAELLEELQTRGHDAVSVPAEKLIGSTDAILVQAAHKEARVLLTLDKGIPDLVRTLETHSGVVLFRPGSMGQRAVFEFVRTRLPELLQLNLEGSLTVVSQSRIRMR